MDAISLASYRVAVAELLSRCFAEWHPIAPEVWAEDVRRMKGGLRFKWAYAPYLRKMFNSLFEPGVIETIFELFSRAGKSEIVLNAIGYFIDQEPRRTLSLWPTEKHAEKFSKDNLTLELFDPTPCLQYLGTKGSKRTSGNTMLHKIFPGGLLDLFGANAPGDMRRAKGNFLYGEEIDAIGSEQTDEGDQLAIFNKRGDEYPDTIRVFASYPSIKGASRIHAKLEESDWQQWFVTCLLCGGEPYVMHRRQIRYDKDKPNEARLECPRCNGLLNDVQRHAMMMGGDPSYPRYDLWRETQPFRGKRGFQANAMLWPHPVSPKKYPGGFLQMIAQAEIDAANSEDPERSRRVIVNTVDAEPYDPTREDEKPPDWKPLFDRREAYGTDEALTVPRAALVITAMVDCHLNRLEVNWTGYGRKQESWNLLHTVLYGNIRSQEVWDDLNRELARAFKHELGCEITLTIAFVDGGWAAQEVYEYLRRLALHPIDGVTGKVRASKGVGAHGHPLIDPKWRSIARQLKGYHIGTWEAKDTIYQRLKMERNGDTPAGYIHFAQTYSEEFLRQATSEKVTVTYEKGQVVRKYINPDGNRNEALDLLVGNLAAFRLHPRNLDAIEADLIARAKAKDEEEPEPPKRMELRRIGSM